jgi:hypothetical protein
MIVIKPLSDIQLGLYAKQDLEPNTIFGKQHGLEQNLKQNGKSHQQKHGSLETAN